MHVLAQSKQHRHHCQKRGIGQRRATSGKIRPDIEFQTVHAFTKVHCPQSRATAIRVSPAPEEFLPASALVVGV
jgi:hypothetical protein